MRTSWSLIVLVVVLLAFPAAASADPATHFVLSTNVTPTAGVSFRLTVSAQDDVGAADKAFAGTLHFSSSDPQAVLPPDTAVDGGGLSSSFGFDVTLKTAGAQRVAATLVGGGITGTSPALTIAPLAPAKLTISAPARGTPDAAVPFTVVARDQFGNRAPTYAGTVHFTSSDASATLPADAQLTNGLGTFTAMVRSLGTQTIAATDAALGGPPATASIAISAAKRLELVGPASAVAGFPALVGVRALDQAGAFFDGYQGTVHFTSSDGLAELPADVKLVDGEALVFAIFGTPGDQTLTATDVAAPALAGTSDPVAVGVLLPRLPLNDAPPPPPPAPVRPPTPTPPPAIRGLAVKPLCVAKARLLSAPRSGRGALALSFTLSAGARVSVAVERLVHAAPPGRCPRTAGSTTGAVKLVLTLSGAVPGGRDTLAVAAGAARRAIPLAGTAAAAKALAPGAYLVRVRATDAAGRRSALATAKFFVLR